MEDDEFRPPARVENESFRPSLSPTGDVFDDRKVDIAAALVDGLTSEMNQNTESLEGETPAAEETAAETPAEENTAAEQTAENGGKASEEDNASAQNDDDSDTHSSATVATVEIKVAEPIPDVVPRAGEDSTTDIIPEDDKAALTKTTDFENAQKEAREFEPGQKPTAFDGIVEPGQKPRRPSVQNSWARKKQRMKTIWKLWSGIFVCVVMPITIYVVDIIITVNVVERKVYRESLSYYHDINNRDNLPIPKPKRLTGVSYNITDSLLTEILAQSTLHAEREKDEMVKENGTYKEFLVKKRTTRDIPTFGDIPNYVVRLRRDEDENAVAEGNVTAVTSTEAPSSKSPAKEEEVDEEIEIEKDKTESEENEVIEKDKKVKNATKTAAEEAAEKKKQAEEDKARQKKRNEYLEYRSNLTEKITYNWGNQTEFDGKPAHCVILWDFYIAHEQTAKTRNEGWFEFTMKKVAQLQQILFILFTIFGFILCILSIALRADMWFKDEWSSFIIGTYVPYIISTCLCALIFVKESGKSGLRCFICRLANDAKCQDIDPLSSDFPASFPWLTIVFLSYGLKLLDCVIIGGTTLTFVMEKKDKIWNSIFKFIGWMVVFPWLVATPLLGIFRYQVIAEIFPPTEIVAIETILTGFFYCGIALWGVLVIAGPVFCKLRMCDVEDNPLEKDDF